jgi:hypothetical protein
MGALKTSSRPTHDLDLNRFLVGVVPVRPGAGVDPERNRKFRRAAHDLDDFAAHFVDRGIRDFQHQLVGPGP